MKLSALHEHNLSSTLADNLMAAVGKANFKKMQDPNRPELLGTAGNKTLPFRSGSQDTPMSPRHRKFFNAPLGSVQGKSGYGDIDDYESRRTRSNTGGEAQPDVDYPIDQSELDKKIQDNARKAFGNQAAAGQRPRGK